MVNGTNARVAIFRVLVSIKGAKYVAPKRVILFIKELYVVRECPHLEWYIIVIPIGLMSHGQKCSRNDIAAEGQ